MSNHIDRTTGQRYSNRPEAAQRVLDRVHAQQQRNLRNFRRVIWAVAALTAILTIAAILGV
ncbi:hypothetical protein WDV06_36745 [Streptomyces racemochromogenes]|uniref:Uncharacterized protein n=1 Tax=Streptomyces racemochromogenes TaxID=67353 RepID=A0ABW7PQA6_9ACTN